MNQSEILEAVFNQSVLYFAIYSIPVLIAYFYDRSKNVSVGVFASVLAAILTLIYIINVAVLLNTETGASVGIVTGLTIGLTAIFTIGYLGFRTWQEKSVPTIITTKTGEVVLSR